MKKLFFFIALLTGIAGAVNAQIIFQQQFNTVQAAVGPAASSFPSGTYVNASPSTSQFNAVTVGATSTLSVPDSTADVLNPYAFKTVTTATGSNWAVARTTDFAVTPTSAIVRFNIKGLVGSSGSATKFFFYLGSGFSTASATEANANVHSGFGIRYTSSSFSWSTISGTVFGTTFPQSAAYQLTFATNNTGSSQTYAAPDGTTESIANDTWDLWVGDFKVFNDQAATTAAQNITDFKFGDLVTSSAGRSDNNIDNLSITTFAGDVIPVAPVASAGTGATSSSFNANWGSVAGATNYKLDVSTVSDFSSGTYNTLAAWNFPGTTEDNVVNDASANNLPANGFNRQINGYGVISPTWSTTATGGTTRCAIATGWDAALTNSRSWGVEISTVGYYKTRISSKQTSSGTGPKDFKVQYRLGLNGGWTDVPSGAIVIAGTASNFGAGAGILTNLALPAACDNQKSVYLRWLCTSNTSQAGGTTAAGGTSRIDDILIEGDAGSFVTGWNNVTTGNVTTLPVNSGLSASTTYYYRVRANNATDTSASSNIITYATTAAANTPPVITSNGGGATASINVAENSTTVTTVTATDAEGFGVPKFTISGGADAALFSIVAATGVLTFTSGRDFETPTDAGANGVYDVQVTVNDAGALTDVQDIAVTITNVNEVPVITSNGGGATASINVAENSTAVTTVTATDPENSFGVPKFTISGGADAALFSIVAATGVLTFTSGRDFETPTDAGANGVYDVQVTVNDAGALTDVQDIAVTITDVVEATSPTLSVTNTPQTYTGSPIAATVGSNSAGAITDVKYNGSLTVPTNAGTYAITADQAADGGFTAVDDASAGNFTIDPAAATASVNNSPQTYTGSPIAATFTSNSGGAQSDIKYNGSNTTPTNAGSYTVTVDIAADANHTAGNDLAAGTFTIDPAAATASVNNSPQTYTGSPIAATFTSNSGGAQSDIKYNGSNTTPTNAGSYTVTVDIAADANHTAGNDLAAGTFTIDPAAATASVNNSPQTYTGSPIAATFTSNSGGAQSDIKYNGSNTTPTNAGSYTVTVDIAADANHTAGNDLAAGTFTIDPAAATASVNNSPQTYTGSPIAATFTSNSGGAQSDIQYNGSNTTPTNAGSYTVTVDIAADANHTAGNDIAAGTFTIDPAAPTASVNNSPATYTGSPIAATFTSNSGGAQSDIKYNGSNTTPTNPGTYAVTLDIAADANHSAGNDIAAGNFVINSAAEATADFRSKANGNFSADATWEFDLGGGNYTPASQAPTSSNNVSIIHNVTLDQNFTIGATKNLTLGTGGTLVVDPTRTLTVTGVADFGGKLVTFKSTAAGVGSLGQVASPVATHLLNATNVTVERFIPNSSGFRAWRLLSVPTFGSQTMKASWQEGNAALGNSKPGWGTQLTGPAGTGAGFDATTSAGSILRWNSGAWTNVSSTLGAISADPYKAYFVFVRGDRSKGVQGTNANTSSTTLETNGSLYAGDQTSQSVPPSSFALVGNPYASAINFTTLTRNNVDDAFYIWDAKLANGTGTGQYQTFSGTNYYTSVTGGSYGTAGVSSNTTIESGQAFLVRNSGGSAGNITMHENSKISGTNGNLGFRPATPASLVKLDTRLHKVSRNNEIVDGNAVVFDNVYSSEVDTHDALKMNNTGENLAVLTGTKSLAVEGRPELKDADVIAFKMWNMKQEAYQLELIPANLNIEGLTATLEDAYLHTSAPVSLDAATVVNFTVDANTASSASDRFRVVFKKAAPVVIVDAKPAFVISPNPAEGSNVNLKFINKVEGKYMIRVLSNAGQTIFTRVAAHAGGNSTQVLNLPEGVTKGTYQVEIIAPDKTRTTQSLLVSGK